MKIDLYSSCWNNLDNLEFFFRHYDPFVRKYVFYDDGSTDGSVEFLRTHPRVEVRAMPRVDPSQSRSITTLSPAETCWREGSMDADWVMICDNDEHIYHPDMAGYLGKRREEGITIIPALGYQMLSSSMPDRGLLCETITRGAPWGQMSKMNVFHPRAIRRLNYSPGRHTASPEGDIVAPDQDELLNLHYKYIDFERVAHRNEVAARRLNAKDAEAGLAHRWRFSREQLREDWDAFERRAVDIRHQGEAWRTHSEPRWWEGYRRSAGAGLPVAARCPSRSADSG